MLNGLMVYLRLVGAGFRSQMQYRLDFLVEVAGVAVLYSAQLLNISIVVGRFENIVGWRLPELAFLYALAVVSTGVSQLLFSHFIDLGDVIVKGEFDRYLVRPANPFVLYLGSQVSAANIGHVIFAGGVFIWAAANASISWTVGKLFYLLLVVAGGTLIQGAAIVLVGTLSFWFQRTGTMFYTVVMPSRELIYYPVSVFPRSLQILLTFVVPFAFINYFPAHLLLDRPEVLFHPVLAYLAPVVGFMCFLGAYGLWVLGTRSYSGTGS